MIISAIRCFLLLISVFGFLVQAAEEDDTRRWNKPGIPHSGWEYVDVTDLGDATGVCEMCDRTHIRYLHTVKHDEHEDLSVGCVCAENMCQDYVTPKAHEKVAKKRAAQQRKVQQQRQQQRQQQQDRWSLLNRWTHKSNGNYVKTLRGNCVTLFSRNGSWKYVYNGDFGAPVSTAELAKSAFVAKYAQQIEQDH